MRTWANVELWAVLKAQLLTMTDTWHSLRWRMRCVPDHTLPELTEETLEAIQSLLGDVDYHVRQVEKKRQ